MRCEHLESTHHNQNACREEKEGDEEAEAVFGDGAEEVPREARAEEGRGDEKEEPKSETRRDAKNARVIK
ncbi:MAG: hypothetical protein HYT29_02035 [Parcubacteria group bacterium]|nr:hypothetical protein [Parcubacteria group bacterium]